MFCHSRHLTGRRSQSEEEVRGIPDSLSHTLLSTRRLLLTVFLAMVAWLIVNVVAECASADPGPSQAEAPYSATTEGESSPSAADDDAPARSSVGGQSTESGEAPHGGPSSEPAPVTDEPVDGDDPPHSEQPAPQVEPVPAAQGESSPKPVSGPAAPAVSGDAAPAAPNTPSAPQPTSPPLASPLPPQPGSPVAPAPPRSAPLLAGSMPLPIAEPTPLSAPAATLPPPPEVPVGTSTGADAPTEALPQLSASQPPAPGVNSLFVDGGAIRGPAAQPADSGVCRPAVVADSTRTATTERREPAAEPPAPSAATTDPGQTAPLAPPAHPAPSPVAPTSPSAPCTSAPGGSITAGGGHGSHHDLALAVGADGSGVAATQAEVRRIQRAADQTSERAGCMEPPPD